MHYNLSSMPEGPLQIHTETTIIPCMGTKPLLKTTWWPCSSGNHAVWIVQTYLFFCSLSTSCSCVLCPVSCVLCPVSCVLCPVSCVLCPVSCVLCPVSCVLCPVSCVLCPVSCVLCPALCPVNPNRCSCNLMEKLWSKKIFPVWIKHVWTRYNYFKPGTVELLDVGHVYMWYRLDKCPDFKTDNVWY